MQSCQWPDCVLATIMSCCSGSNIAVSLLLCRRFENFAEKRLAALRHAPLALLTKGTDLAGLERSHSFMGRFQR